jgi:signal transduction histidine kinase
MIAAHGGRIWAENAPGGGAVFRFTLSVAPDHSQG